MRPMYCFFANMSVWTDILRRRLPIACHQDGLIEACSLKSILLGICLNPSAESERLR
jgi:hypothetical protein